MFPPDPFLIKRKIKEREENSDEEENAYAREKKAIEEEIEKGMWQLR